MYNPDPELAAAPSVFSLEREGTDPSPSNGLRDFN
jgi:hypothetical protein